MEGSDALVDVWLFACWLAVKRIRLMPLEDATFSRILSPKSSAERKSKDRDVRRQVSTRSKCMNMRQSKYGRLLADIPPDIVNRHR